MTIARRELGPVACVACRILHVSAFVLVANASGEAMRELVKGQVEFLPALKFVGVLNNYTCVSACEFWIG